MQATNSSTEEQKGFYVEPKRDCPHINAQTFKPEVHRVAANGPCEAPSCGHNTENWVCLTCSKRFCSRYVKGHMVEHNQQTKHPLVASYSDLSFWCFECDSYVVHPSFGAFNKAMNLAKFGDSGTGGRYTAHASMERMIEHEEEPDVLQEKIRTLASWVRESKHMIAFTGAGISTSAGIPDFRGPQGVWTLKATGGRRTAKTVPTLSAMPTPCHMALVKLQDEGVLKYLISQNVDGLHRRSGILPSKISELHGNSNLEVCDSCGKEYLRDYNCSEGSTVGHFTGRRCSVGGCGGRLLDTIVHFGESLPLHVVSLGFEESREADLCICLGSSLTVTPAADMPKHVGEKSDGRLVIVNLQKTPLDRLADLRIFAKTDTVMEGLMKELGLEIPPFRLSRRIVVKHVPADSEGAKPKIIIKAIDVDGTPTTLFCGVEVLFTASGRKLEVDAEGAREGSSFVFDVNEGDGTEVDIRMHFMGHYNEPPYSIKHNFGASTSTSQGGSNQKRYLLSFDPVSGEWQSAESDAATEQEREEGMENENWMDKLPEQITHNMHDHPLNKLPMVYGGGYRCNRCLKVGNGWVYHCAPCQFDLHPTCAIWRRD